MRKGSAGVSTSRTSRRKRRLHWALSIPGQRGLFDSEDAETLYEGMVPGSAVVALAIEHTWALALVNALYQAGVDVALNFRVPALVVDEAFASLGADV